MERSESDRIVPSVLLVDDRPENLLALEGVLKPLGARLVKARSGEEALLQLLRETFAVILLDVQMPRLDGLQTAELIKQREQTRHIPIIFITALSRETAYIFKGYQHRAGAASHLPADRSAEPVGGGPARGEPPGSRNARDRAHRVRSQRAPRRHALAYATARRPAPDPRHRSGAPLHLRGQRTDGAGALEPALECDSLFSGGGRDRNQRA